MTGKIKRFLSFLVLSALALQSFLGYSLSGLDRAMAAGDELEEPQEEIAGIQEILPITLEYDLDQSVNTTVELTWTLEDAEAEIDTYQVFSNNGQGEIDYTVPAEELINEMVWNSDELVIGQYQYAVKGYNDGVVAAESNIVSFSVLSYKSDVLPGETIEFAPNIKFIGQQKTAGANSWLEVKDRGSKNSWDSLPNGVMAFGHYYTMEAGKNALPSQLRIYYSTSDLIEAGLKESQLTGIYYYNSIEKSWSLYEKTGVITADSGEYSGYIWANLDHLTPVVSGADVKAPVSSMKPLAELTRTSRFNLEISATDKGGSGVKSIGLYYKKDSGDWKLYKGGINPSVKTVEFISSADGLYSFKAIATDKAGNAEEKVATDTQTRVDTVKLGTVTDLEVKKTDSQLVLSWDAVKGAEGYVVKWGTDLNVLKKQDVEDNRNVTFLGLDLTKTWYFQVLPYRLVNGVQEFGQFSQAQFQSPVTEPIVPAVQVAVVEKAQAAEVTQPEEPKVVSQRTERPALRVTQAEPKEEPAPAEQVKEEQAAETRSWSRLITVLLILLILAAAASGYYGYQWWMAQEKGKKGKKKANSKPKARW